MTGAAVVVIMRKEMRDAWRHRWFVVFAATFAILSLALSWLGLSGLGLVGVSGFGRTAASLVNLVLLIVPLLGLLMGAVSVVSEREHGTLLTLMAQPVTLGEILMGKWLGLAAALALAIGLGFCASALVIARAAGLGQLGSYVGVLALALLLGWVCIGLGLCVSVVSSRTNTAIGVAVAVWLLVALVSDLGIMGTAMVLRLSPGQLLWLSLGNPLQIFKVAVIQAMHGNLELLGASGLYAASVLGEWLLPVLTGLLLAWMAAALGVAYAGLKRRGGV